MSTAVVDPGLARTGRPSVEEVRQRAAKDIDAWWTVLVIDPIAVRLVRLLAPVSRVTPNGLTASAALLGVAAAAAFATGHFVWGALLFEVRFLVDCLDGKLARVRSQFSPAGGFLDISSDIALTAACYGGVAVALAGDGALPVWLAVAVPAAFLYQYWTWLYLETHGRDRSTERAAAGLRGWLAKRRLAFRPRSVDVEAGVLFLVPVFISTGRLWVWLLAAAAAYYGVGALMNWWRVVRLLNRTQPEDA